jgi:uncharacterized protein
MNPLKRNLYEKATQMLAMFPVVAILGARQCGKTTFAKQLAPGWTYFDLEKPEHWEKIAYDPSYFFKEYPEHVIIDEAQLYPDLFKILRGVCDEKPGVKGRFILTGSSSPILLTELSESLAGRVANLEMGTLKSNELYQLELSPFYKIFDLSTAEINRNMLTELFTGYAPLSNDQMMNSFMYGGYPEAALQSKTFYKFWMEQYRDTYINRDIAKLFPKINRVAYRRFVETLSQLSGTILNKCDVARSIEVSEGTVREYVSIIEGTYIWRNLPSYEENVIKSVIKMPKGYMVDSGLQNFLLRIRDKEALLLHPQLGRLFECFVMEEIIKAMKSCMIANWQPYYYRTRNGAEIDLILRGEFGVIPIEVKYGNTIVLKKLQSLETFITEHKCPFGIVVNNADSIEWVRPNIVQIPIGYI